MAKGKKTFGETLRELRKNKGVNMYEAAEGIGVAEGRLSEYENDKHMPNVYKALDIADYYGVNFEALIRGDLS